LKMSELLGHPENAVMKMRPSSFWPLPNCCVGLEYEFENPMGANFMAEVRNLPWYTVKRDGSLRDGGIEFVFIQPLYGEDVIDAITALDTFVKRHPLVTNHRTGLHVHLDVRDMEQEQLLKLFVLYCIFEKSIFDFVGNDRYNNNFAVPWLRHGAQMDTALMICTDSKTGQQYAKAIDDRVRYSALNLAALTKFGSVEWRQAQCTSDSQFVFKWVSLILAMKRAAMSGSTNTRDILQEFSNAGPLQFARSCGLPDWFVEKPDISGMWEGVMFAHELIQPDLGGQDHIGWVDTLSEKFKAVPRTPKTTRKVII
jgi:Putative amidoligase enzyme